MATGNIKGITIEIGGDTQGLDSALKDVNKQSKDLQSELKSVERALKFDPGNTTLVAQQQQLLSESIQATSQKLDTLRSAQSQVEAQFANGDIGAEQYRAFQRELINTESQMNSLQSRLDNVAVDQERLAQTTRQLGTFFEATGTDVEQFSGTLGTRLTQSIRDGTASADQMERALRLMGQQALGAGTDIDEMRAALRNVDNGSSLTDVRADLEALRPAANEAASSVDGLNDKIKGVAAGLAAGGGLALAFNQALDVSSLNTKIDITMDINEEDVEAVRATIKNVEAYGLSAEEALEGVRRQFALNGEAGVEANQEIIKSASAIGAAYDEIDFKELIQESFEMSKIFGISQQEALGMTQALLKIGFPPEQLDIISEYGNQLQMAGYNAEEIQAIFAAGVETGTWNIDILLDGVKEGRIVMAEFGAEVDDAMKEVIKDTDISAAQLQEWGKAVAEGGQGGTIAMQEVAQAIADIDDKTKQNEVGVKVFGTLWEENGTNITDTLLNMNNHLVSTADNQAGLNKAVEAMDADPAVRLQKALSDLQEQIAPLLASVAEFVGSFANWVSENKALALTLGSIAAVVGTLVGAFALLAPGIAAVIPLFTAGGVAAGVLGGALALITGPVGLIVAGLAAVGIGAVVMGKELSESSIQVDDWTTKVSEGTAKAVGGFLDLNTQATTALNELNWSGTAVTQEMANNIAGIYQQMGDQVLAEMQADHQEELNTISQHFANTSSLNQAEESAILDRIRKHNSEKETATKAGTDRITEILNTAAKENREVSETEQKEINSIQETMKKNAIKYMSESEAEQKAILETLKKEATKITAQQAADVVNNSKKQKDESVKEADNQYNETVKWAISQRDETGTISKEEADKIIGDAKLKRDEATKKAEEMHKNVVTEAKSQAKEHAAEVDWETGEVKSKFQVMSDNVNGAMKKAGKFISDEWNKAWTATNKFTEDTKKNVSDGFTTMGTEVNTLMKSIGGFISTQWNAAEKFLSGIDLKQIGKDIINGLINGISEKFSDVKKVVQDLAGNVTTWAKDILGIKSPSRVFRDEVGRMIVEGMAVGMSDTRPVTAAMTRITDDLIKTADKANAIIRKDSIFDIFSQDNEFNFSGYINDNFASLTATIKEFNSIAADIRTDKFDKLEEEMGWLEYYEFGNLSTQEAIWSSFIQSLEEGSEDYIKTQQKLESIQKAQKENARELAIEQMLASGQTIEQIKEDSLRLEIFTEQIYKKTYGKFNEMYENISGKDDLFGNLTTNIEKDYNKIVQYTNDTNKTLKQQIELVKASLENEEFTFEERAKLEGIFLSKKQEVNQKLIDLEDAYNQKVTTANNERELESQRLIGIYEDEVNKLAGPLSKFAGLFDKVEAKTDVTGQKLIDNLKSQVDYFADWSKNIALLAERGISDGLLEEIKGMGVKAGDEIAALTSLSDEELQQYVQLWKDKNELARKYAESELVDLKESTDAQIDELNKNTAVKLEEYKNEWVSQTSELKDLVLIEMYDLTNELPDAGQTAMQGFIDGMKSMKNDVIDTAQSIASAVSSTLKSAFDINDSNVFGKLIGSDGVLENINQSSKILTDAVSNAYSSIAASSSKSQVYGSASTNSSNTVDNRKNFNPTINVYTTESPEKAMRRELKRMAFLL